MKILIVTATWPEVKGIAEKLQFVENKDNQHIKYTFRNNVVEILVAGIGPVFTAYRLTRLLSAEKYDLVLNVGICGSYNRNISIGEVVHIVSDAFGDLGIGQTEGFSTLFETGFMDKNEFPFTDGKIKSSYLGFENLKKAASITVGKSQGRSESIDETSRKFAPDTESMEGAAVFYTASQFGIPFCQVRSVSNYVEPRNLSAWNIPLAIENLKNEIISHLESL